MYVHHTETSAQIRLNLICLKFIIFVVYSVLTDAVGTRTLK